MLWKKHRENIKCVFNFFGLIQIIEIQFISLFDTMKKCTKSLCFSCFFVVHKNIKKTAVATQGLFNKFVITI